MWLWTWSRHGRHQCRRCSAAGPLGQHTAAPDTSRSHFSIAANRGATDSLPTVAARTPIVAVPTVLVVAGAVLGPTLVIAATSTRDTQTDATHLLVVDVSQTMVGSVFC